ncbi:NAD-dependent epimerase/dehydratase family protein [Halobacillus litoralis]|uniref:NAD-dependent epimerase/dehydratase family protein n=1 Tax=Halobacillus litoralis TaxID=45668 RepID=A0A845DWP0_9BACI|nr:GDP-mannose 4,6-dehydratase [Halobacillus litoralis]MCA1022079.1 GDP-mannose 4,6-dehydratase [Halobacillus litoralis]MYL21518.1 NAD-dependent epimerase/dehydratase family protein [Halobacillus litoralis]MYL37510.1 NAD-dependent epimerase/dehydratase family protein [Halobacillus litoralis]
MNVLVTGGAGFIGRWVVKKLLEDQHDVWVIDNLSNGDVGNIEEFLSHKRFKAFYHDDIRKEEVIEQVVNDSMDICYHLAASINVQDSIDDPETTFYNDTVASFHLLESCRKHNVKFVFMSTCMVYDQASNPQGITEEDPVKPASPYAGSKIAAENMVLSYYHAYQMPVTIVRPFNTYGPYQKTGGEGGVVPIFIKKKLNKDPIQIYGNGEQTRDLLYAEDCARFVVEAGLHEEAYGEILNAGLGRDVSVNQLAELIADGRTSITHIEHIHPQSEISKLLCDYSKAKKILGWEPEVGLEEGIRRTEEWIKSNRM